jgi:hypothetical protein
MGLVSSPDLYQQCRISARYRRLLLVLLLLLLLLPLVVF